MKLIVQCLNHFGDQIVSNAPKASYRDFKGLPQYTLLVTELLQALLPMDGVIEVFYLNKSGNLACFFQQNDHECLKHDILLD